MNEHVSKTKIAERMFARPGGATMGDVIAATGGPQYSTLKKLRSRGYAVRGVKEGSETRYFATPPPAPSYEATITSKGQVTIPKEVRERLGVRSGDKLRFVSETENRVVVQPVELSIRRLRGILGKPPRSATLEEMDEGISRAVVEKYRRAVAR